MRDDIPRLVPIWLLPMVILIIFSLMQCGCRTGGTTLNTNSSGIKSVISSSNLDSGSGINFPSPSVFNLECVTIAHSFANPST